MKFTYITGCDSNYFLQTGILLQAFKQHCPGAILHVCDFGLTSQQKKIFSKLDILLPMPSHLDKGLHPWIYKSSITHYTDKLSFDFLIWIDSDAFSVGSFREEIEKQCLSVSHDEECVFICQGKIGRSWKLASPPGNREYFAMSGDYPYFNSGIWALRSTKVLEEWAAIINKVPKQGMFEQDTFNYLLKKHGVSISKLENDIWNVTHDSLDNLNITDKNTITLNSTPVLVIHITGTFQTVNISIGSLRGTIRVLKNSEMKSLQLNMLKEWVVSINPLLE